MRTHPNQVCSLFGASLHMPSMQTHSYQVRFMLGVDIVCFILILTTLLQDVAVLHMPYTRTHLVCFSVPSCTRWALKCTDIRCFSFSAWKLHVFSHYYIHSFDTNYLNTELHRRQTEKLTFRWVFFCSLSLHMPACACTHIPVRFVKIVCFYFYFIIYFHTN